MNLMIIGCGYVGLTTGVTLAYLGYNVVGVEKDLAKLKLLQEGKSPIHEKHLEQLMHEVRPRLTFTDSVKTVTSPIDIVIIAVGTPPKETGKANIQYVEDAAGEVALNLHDQTYTLVVKSTVPIGTNYRVSGVVNRILENHHINSNISFASNPEFLREGMALTDMLYPDRIVVGSNETEAIEVLHRLYRPILEQTFTPPSFLPRPRNYPLPSLVTTNTTSAEMIKYAANAFLALKISFINEIGGLCEKVGADVVEISRGMGLDPRIGARFLQAGIGWGGSCFPKDTSALIALGTEYNYPMPIIEASRAVNIRQRQLIIEKLQSELKIIRGRTIGILGLAFKPGTDDIREAPAIEIIKMLIECGAGIRAHDPVALANARQVLKDEAVEFYDDPYQMAKGCDGIVLATEWELYSRLDFHRLKEAMRFPFLLDGRNFLNHGELTGIGFIYKGVGRDEPSVNNRGSGFYREPFGGSAFNRKVAGYGN